MGWVGGGARGVRQSEAGSQHSAVFTCSGSPSSQGDIGNCVVRRVDLANGRVSRIAGSATLTGGHADGVGTAVLFNKPSAVAMNPAGTFAIVVRIVEVIAPMKRLWVRARLECDS